MLVDLGVIPGTTVVGVLAGNPEPPPGQGEEFGKSSPIALVVIVLLGLATVVLIRSMTVHLKRVPASFDPAEGPAERDAAEPDAAGRRDAGDAGDSRS